MNKNLDFLLQKPIAHRGLHSDKCPENSLSAFLRAIAHNYPIELDVQLTSDGKLVVFHDWVLERMTGNKKSVSEITFAELEKLRLQNIDEKIPLFMEVLQLVSGRVPIVIEIKHRGLNMKICEKVKDILYNYSGDVAISSFNPFVVRWFKKNMPEIVRGQNFTDFADNNKVVAFVKKISVYVLWLISNNNSDFFAIRASMLPKDFVLKRVQKSNKSIVAYSFVDKSEYDKVRFVVDNYFFDIKE